MGEAGVLLCISGHEPNLVAQMVVSGDPFGMLPGACCVPAPGVVRGPASDTRSVSALDC